MSISRRPCRAVSFAHLIPCHRILYRPSPVQGSIDQRRGFNTNLSMQNAITRSASDEALYNYTSGRWLYNESSRLNERRLHFNVNALRDIIAESVHALSRHIIKFAKIAEGGSFRVFEATFQDSLKVIARLPYPCTLPHGEGIASEAATMEFLRLQGIPVPKIHAWDSSAANPVGAAYMIMEKVEGKELELSWYDMTINERMDVMEKIVDVERKLFDIRFPAYGSLYFQGSLDPSIRTIPITNVGERFCIGPSTEYLWWYQLRNELNVNRGPWEQTDEIMQAVGDRELEWLQRFGTKRYPLEPMYRPFYDRQMVDPRIQQDALRKYLSVIPRLAPKSSELHLPTIRHPDLSPSNILIDHAGNITGIIDWQHTPILPLFLQAKIPKHFQNWGDDDSENSRTPRLPPNFTELSDVEREQEQEIYRRRQVHFFYLGLTSSNNRRHFDAMATHDIVSRSKLYDVAGRPWEGDITSLKAELIRFVARLGSFDYSKWYSASEVETCLDIDAKQQQANAVMQKLRDYIGVNIEGETPAHIFAEAVAKAEDLKQQFLEDIESEEDRNEINELWPFQDHEEVR